MVSGFRVTQQSGELRASLRGLPDLVAVAKVRALNRTAIAVRAVAVQAIAANLGVPQSTVRDAIVIRQATRGNPSAIIEASGSRLPLSAFRARQTARGVSYRIGAQGRSLAPSAFLATLKSGHQGVFRRRAGQGPLPTRRRGRRKPPAAGYVMVGRKPIDELRGPSLPRVFVRQEIRAAMDATAVEAFAKNFAHEEAFLTTGRGVRRGS